MTEKEERYVRAASKILRDLNRYDPRECAAVLALEAQILEGDHTDFPKSRLAGMLRGTINVLEDIAFVIENIKSTEL